MTTSAPIVKLTVLIAAVAYSAQSAEAYRTTRRHPVSRPLSLDVQPTPEIEAQVSEEVAKARRILDDLNTDNLFASPYLVSAIYYHDGFLNGFPVDRSSADPSAASLGRSVICCLWKVRRVICDCCITSGHSRTQRAQSDRRSRWPTRQQAAGAEAISMQ